MIYKYKIQLQNNQNFLKKIKFHQKIKLKIIKINYFLIISKKFNNLQLIHKVKNKSKI